LGIPSAPPAEGSEQCKSLQQFNAIFIVMALLLRIKALGEAKSSGWNARRATGKLFYCFASAIQPQ
jgi:hypothetical protein